MLTKSVQFFNETKIKGLKNELNVEGVGDICCMVPTIPGG